MGTIRFGNDHFAAITGYGNYVQGNISVCHVYYVKGLGHNFFSVGQFYDDMAASSPVCLMSKATSTKSWLWHHRLSHLNFGTINDLTKHDLVDGLPKFKYSKDHLCSACGGEKARNLLINLKIGMLVWGEADSETSPKRKQVKTMKIQAGIQVSRPGELKRQLQLWKRFGRLYLIVFVLVRNIGSWFGGKLIQKLRQKESIKKAFQDMLHWGEVNPLMHTTMVPKQVKTMKIQAGVQVLRPRELRRHLQLWKRFGRYYLIVFVLVRSIRQWPGKDDSILASDIHKSMPQPAIDGLHILWGAIGKA
ncbi:integrase, catalytic region, zinc finger, CCHC-type containing protein [Tanacetum coccineum]|uniref:Integrase, catalytic region, zinc finger, CCHC-type containing protein n=1 Tax=Tanacetum coccineum TaxID=301880 RepID=A0ABQ5G9Q9_9ASTR